MNDMMRLEMKPKLTTQLQMVPRLIQAIEILALPILELQSFIQQQLETNPVLETIDSMPEDGTSQESEQSDLEPEARSTEEEEKKSEESESQLEEVDEDFLKSFENLERDDWGEFYSENRIDRRTMDEEKDKKLEALQNSADRPMSLQDSLFQQFQLCEVPENLKKVGELIIYNISSNGYLRYPLEEIVKSLNPPTSIEDAKKALEYVQKLEPAGIGASTIQECLILQLDEEDSDYHFKKSLIENYLQDIYNNKYPKIAKETGKSIEEIKEVVKSIQRLNPKPGSEYSSEKAHFISPDVVVEYVDGEYIIRLEDQYIPHLQISPFYTRLLQECKKKGKISREEKEMIKKKVESANWIIEAIKQRQHTLYRVVEQLVQHQKDFFEHGVNHLKPLKMQEVADTLNPPIHVSTVSRAISDKYIQTPRGIFPLKFFFTGAVEKEDGQNESRISVKQRIEEIIKKEDKNNPLSDDEIADKLQAELGLEIARRTVTKYRKALKIPSSRRRKQY